MQVFKSVILGFAGVLLLTACQSGSSAPEDRAAQKASENAIAEERAKQLWNAYDGPNQSVICSKWNEPPSDNWTYTDRDSVVEVAIEYLIELGLAVPEDDTSAIRDGMYKVLQRECT